MKRRGMSLALCAAMAMGTIGVVQILFCRPSSRRSSGNGR